MWKIAERFGKMIRKRDFSENRVSHAGINGIIPDFRKNRLIYLWRGICNDIPH